MDQRLTNRNIKREGNIINSQTKILWLCLKEGCNFTWEATPNNILNHRGCSKCANKMRLTNESVDQRLTDRNIKRIENIKGANNKILWLCLKEDCNNIWKTTPDSILNSGSGCSNCNIIGINHKLILDYFKSQLINFLTEHFIKNRNVNEKRDLKFDFYFENYKIGIEYDGKQHYKACNFGGMSKEKSEEEFAKTQERDQYKNQFC